MSSKTTASSDHLGKETSQLTFSKARAHMPRAFSLGCILSICFSFLISGCSKPILKTPQTLPPVVKAYKNVVFHVAAKQMQKTGVYLNKGELFSILTRDILLRSSLIGMIGKDDFGFYVSDINDAYKPGDLFLGFTDKKHSSSVVDISVWKEADYGKIADFLAKLEADNPDNSAISGLRMEINKRNEIYLAELKASKEIQDTQKKINHLKESNEPPRQAVTQEPYSSSTQATGNDISKDERIKRLEAKLSKLTEALKEMNTAAGYAEFRSNTGIFGYSKSRP